MTLLRLLACILLGALSAQAEVVSSFTRCRWFFYQGTEPAGMDQNAKKICQKRNRFDTNYATLYSTHHRIPVYSAYTFDAETKQNDRQRRSSWFIEPQISLPDSSFGFMMPEFDTDRIKIKQAINTDYVNTGYDRGHLNPSCFQCDDDREATFTLTNAAPMDPCFNRVHWYQWEKGVKEFLINELSLHDDAKVYIITGTVPHPNYRIPQREESAQQQTSGIYERVTVPTHIWSAVCFEDRIIKQNSFSFAYIGINEPDSTIKMMPVSDLNSKLADLYQTAENSENPQCRSVKIFVDDCFFGRRNKYEEITKEIKKLIRLPLLQQMPNNVRNFFQMSNLPAKRRCSERSEGNQQSYSNMGYSSLAEFSMDSEIMKRDTKKACVLALVKGSLSVLSNYYIDELRKRDVNQRSDAVQCQQVSEKSDPTAMTAADGTRCESMKRFCKTKNGYKPCCSTPCLYQESRKGYWCLSEQVEIECSPQYSAITSEGKKCKDDHQCGKYGEDYYWCKTISDSWGFCSPPLWKSKAKDGNYCLPNHACAKYGKGYNWCYTDFNENWNYCCNHDDCFSAINSKTCKPNHPCGYHNQDYLWCYTTDDSWEECCTPCSV